MNGPAGLLETLGGEAGCMRLSAAFYNRVAKDPLLRPLFPGKSLRCATEEFAAFLVQFLGGSEQQAQARWWLSLRESHARFRISPAQRQAWLTQMRAALESVPLEDPVREALQRFFLHSSKYVVQGDAAEPEHTELAARWRVQLDLDKAVAALASGPDDESIGLLSRLAARPSVFVGLLARAMQSGRPALIAYVVDAVTRDPALINVRFAGRTLLHAAAGAGHPDVVALLLRLGTDPDVHDRGSHTPLYSVANECGTPAGPDIVQLLVRAGADVNACGGVTRATPLHMAARRGHVEIARALLECGAALNARDRKGDTPLDRARNCRKPEVAQLLLETGAGPINEQAE